MKNRKKNSVQGALGMTSVLGEITMNSKRKGAKGELEFSKVCSANGYPAHRTQQYCGNTGDAADVVGLPHIHVEVKRVERLNIDTAMAQAIHDAEKKGTVPIVAHRRNRQRWLITMTAEDWFKLYREWEAGKDLEERHG